MRKIKMPCMPRNIRADIKTEMKMMLADVLPVCPVGSPEFNTIAIAWIEKNAARFRKKWERYHNGEKEYVIGN
ncbi:MAG: hypothetical protein ABSF80_08215 [Chitinispirillaceae bacterium]|jgi:hypothetical protein